jgi:spore maturation protein CgeB
VTTVDSERLVVESNALHRQAVRRVTRRPGKAAVLRLNRAVSEGVKQVRPDFSFFVQARYITAETLYCAAKLAPNVVYMNDDMFNPANQSFTFREALSQINCILTTKSFNVSEFHDAGAPCAIYLPNAYDPAIHFPAEPSAAERACMDGDIAFIGTFRPERADQLARLIRRLPSLVWNVWGGGWEKTGRPQYFFKRNGLWRVLCEKLTMREVMCEAMGKAIRSNKVILGLLYRANRDLHTSRTFEIPACGGFMLAERTPEHLEYFREDVEAVYFETDEELVDKAEFYIRNEKARSRIAASGYQRCIRSPYRYIDRAKTALDVYRKLLSGQPIGC